MMVKRKHKSRNHNIVEIKNIYQLKMFSHFTGKMNIELSFLVDGHVYKAVLHKEKSCTEERHTKHILNIFF